VDLNRLTLGGRIIALSGLLLFIDSFLPWFRRCADFSSLGGGKICASHNGWNNALSLLGVLIALALVVLVVLEAAGNALPAVGTVTWGQITMGAAAVAAFFVILQVIIGDSGVSRSVGAYLGVVFALALAYGGFLRMRDPVNRPYI
jgi:hypothetical protein